MTKNFQDFLNEAMVLQFAPAAAAAANQFKMTQATTPRPASVVSFEHEQKMRGADGFGAKHNAIIQSLHSSGRQFQFHIKNADYMENRGEYALASTARDNANKHADHFYALLPDYINHHASNPDVSKQSNHTLNTHLEILNHATDMTEESPNTDRTVKPYRFHVENKLRNLLKDHFNA